MTYVIAASHTSNGFQLVYRILELVLPRLRQAKGGIHKNIPAPSYLDVSDDSIYTFLTKYKNFLLLEQLSPENRIYNETEQTLFIISALKHDARLKTGVQYVASVLHAYQRDYTLNPSIPLPLELQHDNIGVVLDEHSDDYTVGDNASKVRLIYNDDSIRTAHAANDTPVIHALRSLPSQDNLESRYTSRKSKKPAYDRK